MMNKTMHLQLTEIDTSCHQVTRCRHTKISNPNRVLPRADFNSTLISTTAKTYRRRFQTSSSSHYIIAASSQQSRSITNKSAVLHDFCIVIPYGAILIAGAAIHALTGSRALLRADLAVAAAGVLQILLSKMTLSKWRSGRSSAVVTMVEAVVAGGMGYAGWEGWRQGVGKIGSGCLAVVSVVVAVVLVYNVLAGGNPPKKSAE